MDETYKSEQTFPALTPINKQQLDESQGMHFKNKLHQQQRQ